jgi:hypothetical protein
MEPMTDGGDGGSRRGGVLATSVSVAVHAALLAGLIVLFRHGARAAHRSVSPPDSSIPALIPAAGHSMRCPERAFRSTEDLISAIKIAVTGRTGHIVQGLTMPAADSSDIHLNAVDSLCAAAAQTINQHDGKPRDTQRLVEVIVVGNVRVVTDEGSADGRRIFMMDSMLRQILQVARVGDKAGNRKGVL